MMLQKMLSLVRSCADDYGMLQRGDRVAVGVSGGKDSLTLLRVLAELRAFHPSGFELQAITLDMGYEEMDFAPVAALCRALEVPYTVRPTQIKQVIFDIRKEQNPCALCAKMRRGALNEEAKRLGCNKVALGHHYDDAVETFLLSLLYEGRISCFLPVTYLDRTGLTVIRPLLYVHERSIRTFAEREHLPVVHNPCPADKNTKREDVKQLLAELERRYPQLKEHIFGGLQRSPLPGWRPEAGRNSRPQDGE
jgi:tRNA 2-thiocytidine biosynthesis protein TtcA